MDLYSELDAFDGKHTDGLESLSARITPDAETVDRLCTITEEGDTRLQAAATWMLKRFGAQGREFSATQVENLLDLLAQVPRWDAKLHLLQTLPSLRLPATRTKSLYHVLTQHLSDANKFVRAWSFNGMVELADQHAEYRDQVRALLEKAQQEESASVKARIRNAVKGRAWLSGI